MPLADSNLGTPCLILQISWVAAKELYKNAYVLWEQFPKGLWRICERINRFQVKSLPVASNCADDFNLNHRDKVLMFELTAGRHK